ncbi:hypothetical protein EV702DRAFT_1203778 [Suillus placidus]|uniref:Uncharacterized protein n=1 Tax=Suillus placidus TaxID=48579 RepID=A0A9P6ZJ56_9AGAM|nr:hypothetical protein EV702DRAFT_1203778 [Suillus placidus]
MSSTHIFGSGCKIWMEELATSKSMREHKPGSQSILRTVICQSNSLFMASHPRFFPPTVKRTVFDYERSPSPPLFPQSHHVQQKIFENENPSDQGFSSTGAMVPGLISVASSQTQEPHTLTDFHSPPVANVFPAFQPQCNTALQLYSTSHPTQSSMPVFSAGTVTQNIAFLQLEGMIAPPPGVLSKPSSGGYALKEVLGWEDLTYRTVQVCSSAFYLNSHATKTKTGNIAFNLSDAPHNWEAVP